MSVWEAFLLSYTGMGTKIQYATSALATTPPGDSFRVSKIVDWDNFTTKGLKEDLGSTVVNHKFKDSMDRGMIEQQKIESIKNTMLMHQDIFKHQVRELHRLYSIQKMLMVELRNQETTIKQRDRFWAVPLTTGSDHTINYSNFFNRHQPRITACTQTIHVQGVLIGNNSSSCKRSGSCSGDQDQSLIRIPKKGFDLERQPAVMEEDISGNKISNTIQEDRTGPTSSFTAMNHCRIVKDISEESDVELTLSIGGGCMGKSKIVKSETGDQCGNSNTIVGNLSPSDQQKSGFSMV